MRAKLLSELQAEQDYGVLLLTQIGGAPNELQMIVETAVYDEAAQGLRPRGAYAIRVLGVREHRATLGVFGTLKFLDEHPLLFHHNTPRTAVHFDGKAKSIYELVLDISQAYVSTFGRWRNIIDQHDDINNAMPLVDLLATGYGMLGTMPKPLAERISKVLAHHGVRATLSEDANFSATDEHGRSKFAKLLLIDTSYVIALDFSVDQVGAPR